MNHKQNEQEPKHKAASSFTSIKNMTEALKNGICNKFPSERAAAEFGLCYEENLPVIRNKSNSKVCTEAL